MKNVYTIIIVLILVVVGVLIFTGKGSKLETPVLTNDQIIDEMSSTTTSTTSTTAGMKEFTILGQNFSFIPNSLTVKKGDKVRITFKRVSGFHDFVIDEYGVASKQLQSPAEEILEFTADKVGNFQYYCSVGSHRAMGMWGTLKVEE